MISVSAGPYLKVELVDDFALVRDIQGPIMHLQSRDNFLRPKELDRVPHGGQE